MAGKSVFKFAGATGLEKDVEDVDINDEEEEEEELPAAILNRVIALKEDQDRYDELDAEYKKERIAIEKKYFELKQALYAKRAQIVTGTADVEQKVAIPDGEEDPKSIPGFWTRAISNHPMIGGLVTEEDRPALDALKDIKVDMNEDWSGFSLTFVFGPNPYFENTELVKKYEVSPDLLGEVPPELNSVEGTEIAWLPGKNLTVKETKKKQKAKSGRNAGQTRFITKQEPVPSFFHYFSDPRDGDAFGEDEEEEEENPEDEHKLGVDEDYEVAHTFRVEIVPSAVMWFTGEAADMDFADEDDEEEEEDEEEGEEGPEDEGDDDVAVTGSAETGFKTAGGEPNQQECKQS